MCLSLLMLGEQDFNYHQIEKLKNEIVVKVLLPPGLPANAHSPMPQTAHNYYFTSER